MSYPYIIQGNNLVVIIQNKSHTISKTHITYQKVVDAIKANDWDTVKDIIEPKKIVLNYGRGHVSIQGEVLYWKGQELDGSLAVRMISMLQEGFPIEPMVRFMENLMDNPSHRAVNELYAFLEKCNLPITPDGCFLAYKKIRDDFKDVHSGAVLNKPAHLFTNDERANMPLNFGKVFVNVGSDGLTGVWMARNYVDDNALNTCSEGLHFCSESYLQHFSGERIIILKINPADVVSIPADHNDAKGRTCRYQIVGELGVEPEEAFTAAVQENANQPLSGYDRFPDTQF